MHSFLVSNGLIVDARIALGPAERVVLIPTSCDTDRGASLEHLLTCLGFRKADTPYLSRPLRSVVESLGTQVSLWLRDRQASEDVSCRNEVAGGASNPVHFKDDATSEEPRVEIERRLNILQKAGILELKIIEPEVQ
jgi:hypothetical protein